jgi:hypothetical protein
MALAPIAPPAGSAALDFAHTHISDYMIAL